MYRRVLETKKTNTQSIFVQFIHFEWVNFLDRKLKLINTFNLELITAYNLKYYFSPLMNMQMQVNCMFNCYLFN